MNALKSLFIRELRLAYSSGGGPAGPAAFYLAALTLAPIAIGPDTQTLALMAPGLIGFAALLASLQPAERVFSEDVQDGSLELYALSKNSLSLVCLTKALAFIVAIYWPLPLLALVAGLAFAMTLKAAFICALALTLALPGLGLIASFAGALAAGLKRAGLLIALIATPLQLPLLVFASAAARSAMSADHLVAANLMMTAAGSLVALALTPLGMAAALKSRLN